jgi:hypothetical protein
MVLAVAPPPTPIQAIKARMSRSFGLILILALGLSSVACRGTRLKPDVAARVIDARIAGIKHAGETHDRSALPGLIDSLNDDDPAVRMFAIVTLEKFSRDRFGYEYYLDEEQRKPSIARWREWLKQQQQEQSPQQPDGRPELKQESAQSK